MPTLRPLIPLERLIEAVIREVAELPDRTSPDDQPDMMMVTGDELGAIIERVFDEIGGA